MPAPSNVNIGKNQILGILFICADIKKRDVDKAYDQIVHDAILNGTGNMATNNAMFIEAVETVLRRRVEELEAKALNCEDMHS